MADLSALLQSSLNPQSRKQAEQSLDALATQPGFLSHLLTLVLDPSQQAPIRLSGAIYLKNVAKLRWEEDVQPLPEQDKSALKNELIPAMLRLSPAEPSNKPIRAQIAESIALIAELDFPAKWPDLISALVNALDPSDYGSNLAILQSAHSIFSKWRSQVRSDSLFTEINLVLGTFMDPFLALFRQSAAALLSGGTTDESLLNLLGQTMVLLIELYHDLTCQDLPPAIEDSHEEFFKPGEGWFQRFLVWEGAGLTGDPDDTAPSILSQIKTGILEIAELFVKLYPEQLQKTPAIEALVEGVWALVGEGRLPGVGDDALVSTALRFLSTAIRSGFYKSLFEAKETIAGLVQGVVVPNVVLREHDLDRFTSDPLEYIRTDLSISSSLSAVEGATRRQAASQLIQALIASPNPAPTAETTAQVGLWIQKYLKPEGGGGWRERDAAIFLFGAIATRGSTLAQGVTALNTLVDVVGFFEANVWVDLAGVEANVDQETEVYGKVHPMLMADAIRFLGNFRSQLSKPQLLSVLPVLVRRLGSANYVTYTYAAITLYQILALKQGGKFVFGASDVKDFADPLVDALLSKIEQAGSADKVAENDHLMKCIMRVILTAREMLLSVYQQTLHRLVAILGVISKNPTNPNFDQYIFESLSALMRFSVGAAPEALGTFEQTLFGPFTIILQQDIDQYIPYTFQILAQMLELHTSAIPPEYGSLLPFLLTPQVWQQKGSIPGLVKLLKAFLEKDAAAGQMTKSGQVASVLAVVQQRLIPSKANDVWGFELLKAVVRFVKPDALRQYFKVVMMTLLTRMQTNKTDKFVYLFAYFILYAIAIPVDGLGPDYVIGTIEEIQPQLWTQILTSFVTPQVPKMPHKERKVAAVGLTRMLTESALMLNQPAIGAWPATFAVLASLFKEPQYLAGPSDASGPDAVVTEIDFEEQTAGYQAAYSRLAASEGPVEDPVAHVRDVKTFVSLRLAEMGKREARLRGLVEGSAGLSEDVRSFVQMLGF